MSTSEFDRRLNGSEDDLSPLSLQERGLPADFSAEDLAFAQELGDLFAFAEGETPPYFAQTLLESENPRFQALEDRFEQKTNVRVFRSLKLRRRLYHSYTPSFTSVLKESSLRRPLTALGAACILFMLATMIYTGPLFASGLSILWSGAHSGALLTKSYPTSTATTGQAQAKEQSNPKETRPREIEYTQAQSQLNFPVYLPQNMPSNYNLNNIYLYHDDAQGWADGPIMQLDYTYQLPGVTPHGTGKIVICEFKPQGKVFQAIKFDAAHQIHLAGRNAQAVYVDGQWVRVNNASHEWVYGMRSELIYELNGVVFWIVGDQRDGVSKRMLGDIAQALEPFNLRAMGHINEDLINVIADSINSSSWEFPGQIIYNDLHGAPSLNVVGAEPNQPNLDVPVVSP